MRECSFEWLILKNLQPFFTTLLEYIFFNFVNPFRLLYYALIIPFFNKLIVFFFINSILIFFILS